MVFKIKKFLNKLLIFFRTVYIFESYKNKKKITFKHLSIQQFKNSKTIKFRKILEYLKKDNRVERFKKNHVLVVLFYKNFKIIGYGWIFQGKNWFIEEIKKKILIKNKVLLFDFEILKQFRNKQFYKKFLLLIKNINFSKVFLIYALKTNFISIKGINNAGFVLKKKLK